MSNKVLVTGANGGFGSLIIETLLNAGHSVVGSMRDPNGRNAEASSYLVKLGANVVDIDVTNESSVIAGVNSSAEVLGGLDVVINNAGVGVLGFQEAFTTEDIQGMFDINVFGLHRVTRAALEHFHAQGSGLILNISSLLGRITIPFYGPYNASKWAVEALSENYRTELSSFGIDVAIIEPGGFPTSFFNRLVQPSDQARMDKYYAEMKDAPREAFEGFEGALSDNPVQDPQLVADAALTLVNTPAGERPFRTVVDKMGMGEPIVEYNEQLDKVTHGIYSAFGMEETLELKV